MIYWNILFSFAVLRKQLVFGIPEPEKVPDALVRI